MGFAVTGSGGGRCFEGAANSRVLQSHPYRYLGPPATTENFYIWGGNPGSAKNWKTWGQTDVQPFGDSTTTFDQLP